MAKQQGALRFVGRFANAVGYKARDGRGDAFDAVRQHVTDIANPQTLSQMTQRMKLTPVQNFYRGLQGLLNHSWQGVKYRNPSRLHFYSQTMRSLSTYGCPYVNKGDRQFVPWTFPVSSGSVAVDTSITTINATEVVAGFLPTSAASTWGDFSQALIDSNPGIHNGDQLTLILVLKTSTGEFIPVYDRVNVDTSSEDSVSDYQTGNNVFISGNEIRYNGLGSNNYAAAAVIVSRLENNVWQRSNSIMAVADSVRSAYNSTSAFNTMLDSYRRLSNTDSDWYLNDGTASEADVAAAAIKTGSVTYNGSQVSFAYYNIDGNKIVPFNAVSSEGSVLEYLYNRIDASTIARQSEGYIDATSLPLAAAGYQLMALSTFVSTYPEITVQSDNEVRP